MKKNYFVDKKRIKSQINKKIGEVLLTKKIGCAIAQPIWVMVHNHC